MPSSPITSVPKAIISRISNSIQSAYLAGSKSQPPLDQDSALRLIEAIFSETRARAERAQANGKEGRFQRLTGQLGELGKLQAALKAGKLELVGFIGTGQ